jgi:CHU_C Type IX secretion signal domain
MIKFNSFDMIKVLLFSCLVLICNLVFGQEIYSISATNNFSRIISINPETCEEVVVCELPDYEIYELTFHPNGNIFVLGYSSIDIEYSLFEIEVSTCTVVNAYPLPLYFNAGVFLSWVGLCTGIDNNLYIGTTFLVKFDYQSKEFIRLGDFNLPFRFVHDMSLINGNIVMCVSQFTFPIEFSIEVDLNQIENSKIFMSNFCGINTFFDCNSSDVYFINEQGLNKFNTIDSLPSIICPFNNNYEWKGLASKDEFLVPLRTLDLGPSISICRAESHSISIPTITGDQVLWSDGNTQANRVITSPAHYIISITSSDECIITDSITISRSYAKVPKITTIDLCEGEIYDYRGQIYQAGQTIIDSLEATTGCDTLWTITLRAIAAPSISRDTTTCDNSPIFLQNKTYQIGDTINLLKNSPTGCDTLFQLVYKQYQSSVQGVSLKDTSVCKDGKTQLEIDASSFSGVIWSNGDQSAMSEFGEGVHFLQATDDRGCVRMIPFEIKTHPSIQYEIQATGPSCGQTNGSIAIINNLLDLPFTTSINGIITQSSENLPAGKYNILLTDANKCQTQDSLTLTDVSDLEVTMPSDINGVVGQIISIAYQSSGGSIDTITFSPNADINWLADSIAVAITGDRVYSITFIDEYGCTVTKTLSINAEFPTNTIILPNIVSSLSTNTENTLFYLKTGGITYDMSIYDRWGNLIHNVQKITGGDPSQAWQPSRSKIGPGVYVYLIAIQTEEGVMHKYGTVTVL